MCGLGQSAPNPVLSTLRYFRDEFLRHIHQKRCDAFVCKDLVAAPCQSACPIGTEPWRYIAHIAREEYVEAYQAIRETNPFPSVCARVCNHPCEERCRAGTHGGKAVAIRALKRFITDQIEPSTYKPVRTGAAHGRHAADCGRGSRAGGIDRGALPFLARVPFHGVRNGQQARAGCCSAQFHRTGSRGR